MPGQPDQDQNLSTKKKRTRKTLSQLTALRNVMRETKTPTDVQINGLVSITGLRRTQVKSWFAGERQKEEKERAKNPDQMRLSFPKSANRVSIQVPTARNISPPISIDDDDDDSQDDALNNLEFRTHPRAAPVPIDDEDDEDEDEDREDEDDDLRIASKPVTIKDKSVMKMELSSRSLDPDFRASFRESLATSEVATDKKWEFDLPIAPNRGTKRRPLDDISPNKRVRSDQSTSSTQASGAPLPLGIPIPGPSTMSSLRNDQSTPLSRGTRGKVFVPKPKKKVKSTK